MRDIILDSQYKYNTLVVFNCPKSMYTAYIRFIFAEKAVGFSKTMYVPVKRNLSLYVI